MGRSLKLLCIVLLAFICSGKIAAEEAIASAKIDLKGDHSYKSVTLSPETYAYANHQLSNLRLRDLQGQDIPYFILSQRSWREIQQVSYAARFEASFVKDDYYYHDFSLLEQMPNVDVQINQLALRIEDSYYANEVDLLGSFDGLVWEPICRDKVFQVEGYRKTSISFPKTEKYTHYRLRYYKPSGVAPLRIAEVSAEYNTTAVTQERFSRQIALDFSVSSKDKVTTVVIENPHQLRIAEITLKSDDFFNRRYTLNSKPGEIAQFVFPSGITVGNTTIPVSGEMGQKLITLVIYNNDDAPIKIHSLDAVYYVDELIFASPKSEACSLVFLSPETTAPVYDIVKYREYILEQDIDACLLSEVNEIHVPLPETPRDYTWLLNTVVVGISIMLGAIILTRLKKG